MLYVLKSDHVGLLYPFRRFVLRGHFPRPKGEDNAGVTDFAPINGVCAILLRLYTSTECLKRFYTSPGPILEIYYFK